MLLLGLLALGACGDQGVAADVGEDAPADGDTGDDAAGDTTSPDTSDAVETIDTAPEDVPDAIDTGDGSLEDAPESADSDDADDTAADTTIEDAPGDVDPDVADVATDGVGDSVDPPVSMRLRIVAANLTSGTHQRYEGPGIRILQGLAPDITLLQEASYVTEAELGYATFADFIHGTFGADATWHVGTGSLPNGIVSRYPILASGTWDDSTVPNRGFDWARIDIPGARDLWAVSLHLKASSSDADTRATAAAELVAFIGGVVPDGDLLVMGGDLNTYSRTEAAIDTLAAVVDTAGPWPDDGIGEGDGDTNSGRTNPYDWVLGDDDLDARAVPVVIGTNTFPAGAVIDTRVYQPLSDIAPAQAGDSGASGMQHMAVVRDFDLGCAPSVATVCADGVVTAVDDCGNPGEVIETCGCGCNGDGTACRACSCTPDPCNGQVIVRSSRAPRPACATPAVSGRRAPPVASSGRWPSAAPSRAPSRPRARSPAGATTSPTGRFLRPGSPPPMSPAASAALARSSPAGSSAVGGTRASRARPYAAASRAWRSVRATPARCTAMARSPAGARTATTRPRRSAATTSPRSPPAAYTPAPCATTGASPAGAATSTRRRRCPARPGTRSSRPAAATRARSTRGCHPLLGCAARHPAGRRRRRGARGGRRLRAGARLRRRRALLGRQRHVRGPHARRRGPRRRRHGRRCRVRRHHHRGARVLGRRLRHGRVAPADPGGGGRERLLERLHAGRRRCHPLPRQPTLRRHPPSGSGFSRVGLGVLSACALDTNGAIVCWGDPADGKLAAPIGGGWKDLAVGNTHACAIDSGDGIQCWGRNDSGPTTVPAGDYLDVSAGSGVTCAVRADHSIGCWGVAFDGRTNAPVGNDFVALWGRSATTCAQRTSGAIAC